MSTFVKVRGGFLLLMALLLLADLFLFSIPWWLYLAPSLLFVILIVAGSAIMSMNLFAKSHTKLPESERAIALTFDDGPSAEHTPAVLAVLEKWGAKATFFCIGERLEQHKELAQCMVAQGHALGNHSFSHSNMFSVFGANRVLAEIEKTNALILETSGAPCRLFRPPYGVMNPPIAMAAQKSGMALIGWSIRSFDTATKDPEKVIKRVIKKIKPGAVILLHDDREHTARILDAILAYAHEHNYRYKLAQDLLK